MIIHYENVMLFSRQKNYQDDMIRITHRKMYNTIKSPYNKVMENKMVMEVMLEKLIRVGLRYYNMYY